VCVCVYLCWMQTRHVRTSAVCWCTVWLASAARSPWPSPTWCTLSTYPSVTPMTTSNAASQMSRPTSASWVSWWTSSGRCAHSGGQGHRRRRAWPWHRRRTRTVARCRRTPVVVRASWWTAASLTAVGLVTRRPSAVCRRCRRRPQRRPLCRHARLRRRLPSSMRSLRHLHRIHSPRPRVSDDVAVNYCLTCGLLAVSSRLGFSVTNDSWGCRLLIVSLSLEGRELLKAFYLRFFDRTL